MIHQALWEPFMEDGPKRYLHRPIEVEAVRVFMENREKVAAWIGEMAFLPGSAPSGVVYAPGILSLDDGNGRHWLGAGDWVVKHPDGTFEKVKNEKFEQEYGQI